MNWSFRRFSTKAAEIVGSSQSFFIALLMVLAWAALGPRYGWSEGHQLFINTITTVVTFLIVFLIQNTQNRDSHALHLKIDELLRALDAADTRLVDLEERSEQELERLQEHYKRLAGEPASHAGTGAQAK
jgi:low affinity Fe/Cu permease